jgi:response regulator RpfG family c-di-GMP phosphodiesterase
MVARCRRSIHCRMTKQILFVDDEPKVLAGVERLLRKDYQVVTATSAAEGLAKIAESGPFAVVLSDMRMPGTNGAEFLRRVREVVPDTVRMVLTGESDIAMAMQAVNEGAVFRFLLKPCAEPALRDALNAALRQYELQFAERTLLEKTLHGSVKVLTEVLSLVNPAAFGRSIRIQRDDAWQFSVAAMLSQIGCVTLPPATVDAIHAGQPLSEPDAQRYLMHASVAHDLLIHVPRLEAVAMMIARQHEPFSASRGSTDAVSLGAQILKVCLAFDERVSHGQSADTAVQALLAAPDDYNPELVSALADVEFDAMSYHPAVMAISRLETGMIIDQDVRTSTGLLMVGRGQEITAPMLVRLGNFHQNGAIPDTVRVLVLRPSLEATA